MSYVRSDFKIFYNEEEIKILHFLLNDTILVQVLELILQYICDIVTRKKKNIAVVLPRICITLVAFSLMHIGLLWILRDPNLSENK